MTNIIRKLHRYLRRHPRVQRLPRHLVTPGDNNGPDVWPILALARAKDSHEVARLMVEHQVDTAADLMAVLPPLPRPSLRERLMHWLRRIEGSTAYDPTAAAMRRAIHEQPRVKIRYTFRE